MAGDFGTIQPSSMDMLSLLIPGPGYPGKCLDVYLRPLIEELKFFWNVGHPTYEKYMHEML